MKYILLLISLFNPLYPCGIALVRLLKPLSYFEETYQNPAWGLHKIYLLMEKQRNRGQDGAGLSVIKFDMPPGMQYMYRTKALHQNAIEHIFNEIASDLPADNTLSAELLKKHTHFIGELYLGHVRYGTHAGLDQHCCQPHIYRDIVPCKQLALIGNFNLTNTSELLDYLQSQGANPISMLDTHLIMQSIAHELDKEYEHLLLTKKYLASDPKNFSCQEISQKIPLSKVISRASSQWDGGYVFAGALGTGDAFVCRDPAGIRPCFYIHTDEVFAVASERAALLNVFNTTVDDIKELPPAQIIVIKKDGTIYQKQFCQPTNESRCSFERIYFSRVNDPDIYLERKQLGKELAQRILKTLNYDLTNVQFTYVPNSGEVALMGCIEEVNRQLKEIRLKELAEKIELQTITPYDLESLCVIPHYERIMFKDMLLRTFITNDSSRTKLVSHIYDVTKGAVTNQTTLVVFDDSIVRGTTLQQSILYQLIRLQPKRIIFVSSAPIIQYPDCYGIDMSQLDRFVGFKAVISLLKEQNKQLLIDQVYQECKTQEHKDPKQMYNAVQKLYAQFSQEQIEHKIAEIVMPHAPKWNGEFIILYQTINGLHHAIPGYTGDWYFTGNYPTPGGYKVLNTSFINWYEGKNKRAY